jgi:alkaline phosphatase
MVMDAGPRLCYAAGRMQKTSFTYKLTAEQQTVLFELLRGGAYRTFPLEHTRIAVEADRCRVALYKSGKCLVQGKGAEDFVMFTLEPLVLQSATLGYEDVLNPEAVQPHMGVDESGKGDFFGPLVVAAAFVDPGLAETMREMDVKDSKAISSDAKALAIGSALRRLLGRRWTMVKIGPRKYNQLYAKMRNVNTLLAWAHARAIENLLEAVPDCPRAVSDQFGSKQQVERALMKKGRGITLEQRHRAESDLAVAAASIIAREMFLRALKDIETEHGVEIPKGASAAVREAAVELVRKHGPAILLETGKTHFKTADAVLQAAGHSRADLGPDGQAVSRPVTHRRARAVGALLLLAGLLAGGARAASWLADRPPQGTGSVIFLHPDGTSAAHWTAARLHLHGPDGLLHWDRLPHLSMYRGHMRDALTATSHGGATTHAYGVKVPADSYGMHCDTPLTALSGRPYSIMVEAMRAGFPAGIVNSGDLNEPGTGCFLASTVSRENSASIVAQILDSGADVILGGGEQWMLPAGTNGVHAAEGRRTDGRNLIAECRARGYTVVFTRAELAAVSNDTARLLGVFAAHHTFNDQPEEALAAEGLEAYAPQAPTTAEMMETALRILAARGRTFLLVAEEEGTDNLANVNNAAGTLEALRRADEAVGVARAFLAEHPATLLITAADSDASGMQVISPPAGSDAWFRPDVPLPAAATPEGAPLDGMAGAKSPPFVSGPDQFGRRHTFGIAWIGAADTAGGIVARAEGLNSDLLGPTIDNTDIYRLVYLTLFGTRLP